ncbi:MAG: hypothetical protein ACN6OP_10730 [Pseudomonadales bacterium]
MTSWPTVPLREVLRLDLHKESVSSSKTYEMVGVLSYGRGLFRRPAVQDGKTSYAYMLRLKAEHIVLSQLFGWEGALALSSKEFEGSYLSPNFPTFIVDEGRLNREFLGWVMRRPSFWADLASRAKGMGDRRRTLNAEAFFQSVISLPSLSEQLDIVSKLDALSLKVAQLDSKLSSIEADVDRLAVLRFQDALIGAEYRPMEVVAPVERRSVTLDMASKYREVGARSFGKGLFAKPDFIASDATWEKPFWIEAGDIVFSNIKAWEGAIALAGAEHDRSIASHRYITCVPGRELVGAFLLYYLLSEDGLEKVGDISSGTADRNRTLSLKKLARLEVPVPSLEIQNGFVALLGVIASLKGKHVAIRKSSSELVPAMLEDLLGR